MTAARDIAAEALFASNLQPSDRPTVEQVQDTILAALRRWTADGCAACLAQQFGDHPVAAAVRMQWCIAIVDTVYPATAPALV